MDRHLLLLISLVVLNYSSTKSQSPERGIALPISEQSAVDLAFGYNGTSYFTVNYDHMFFLKPVRFGPAVLLRGGLGDGIKPGYGIILLAEAAYTTGYLTFAELGVGYMGQTADGNWQNLPYLLAAFRHRTNGGISIRLISRLIMNRSDEIPLFGMGISVGYTF
jgi:hypothetical protein